MAIKTRKSSGSGNRVGSEYGTRYRIGPDYHQILENVGPVDTNIGGGRGSRSSAGAKGYGRGFTHAGSRNIAPTPNTNESSSSGNIGPQGRPMRSQQELKDQGIASEDMTYAEWAVSTGRNPTKPASF